jgi:lysophospholipase L1-like esterase
METMNGRFTNTALALISLLLTMIGLEIALRYFDVRGYHEPRHETYQEVLLPADQLLPGVRVQFRPYSQFEITYDSNPRGYFDAANNGLTYQLNQYGLRGSDFPSTKPTGQRRVLVLGDSFTFGEGVRWPDTFTVQLETLLRAETGLDVAVLNAGIPAWSTSDEIAYLAAKGITFEPDLIVVVYVLNDADYAAGLDLWNAFRAQYEKRSLRGSYLASFVYATIGQQTAARRYINDLVASAAEEQAAWQRSFEFLRAGQRGAAQIEANYMVAVFPFMYQLDETYPFRPLHDLVTDYTTQNNIPTLDLLDAFTGESYQSLWVHPSDQHPNEQAHAIAAQALAQFILANNLLTTDH